MSIPDIEIQLREFKKEIAMAIAELESVSVTEADLLGEQDIALAEFTTEIRKHENDNRLEHMDSLDKDILMYSADEMLN